MKLPVQKVKNVPEEVSREYIQSLFRKPRPFSTVSVESNSALALLYKAADYKGATGLVVDLFSPDDLFVSADNLKLAHGFIDDVKKSKTTGIKPPALIIDGKTNLQEDLIRYIAYELSIPVRTGTEKDIPDDSIGRPRDLVVPTDLKALEEERKKTVPEHLREEILVFNKFDAAREYSAKCGIAKVVIISQDESRQQGGGLFAMMFAGTPPTFNPHSLETPFVYIKLDNQEMWHESVFPRAIASLLKRLDYVDTLIPAVKDFVGTRIEFTPTIMRSFLRRASSTASMRKKPFNKEFLEEFLKSQTRLQTAEKADRLRVIKPTKSFDDLILDKEREALEQLSLRLKADGDVPEFVRKLRPNTQRTIILFTGVPGTGKSASAEAIAKSLGKELWVIDLAQAQSKYVGESEKWMAEYFQKAEKAKAVLLIDEAEMLLRNRQSHDSPYLRQLTNSLVNEFEKFNGTLILTTNFASDIDGAFERRIDYTVSFEMPSKESQIKILRSFLEPDAPLENVDYKAVMEGLDLSGGLIRNAVEKAYYRMLQLKRTTIDTDVLRWALKEVVSEGGHMKENKRTIGLAPWS